jgi:RNA polymerase sigma-70 factor (subfamily 1)
MSTPDDWESLDLIRRACGHDEEAWNLLVLRHTGWLRRLARRLLDPRLRARFDPEDIVQETFANAFANLDRILVKRIPFAAWLGRRVRDQVNRNHRDHLRTKCRSVGRESVSPRCYDAEVGAGLVALMADPGTSPSGRSMRLENGQVLQAAFPDLSEADREILTLFFIERRPPLEIQSVLHVTANTAAQRLHRATKHLRSLLQRSHREWCDALETSSERRF